MVLYITLNWKIDILLSLDRMHGYCDHVDLIFVYKMKIYAFKLCVVSGTLTMSISA